MKQHQITDPAFDKYGKALTGIDWTPLLTAMEDTPLPEGVVYEPSVPALEQLPVFQVLQDVVFGELPIQAGYCNGKNEWLNALEYHRSSEVNLAVTDLVLLLGCQQDITKELTYDTALVEAFLLPAGTAVELYATTLHYAPCNVAAEGFKNVVILPKDTNLALEKQHSGGEDALLAAKNKWLIGHKDADLPAGTHFGLVGVNRSINE